MSVLDLSRYKPLDFGKDGVTGSVDDMGRIIALNCYHPQHGYVTLTAADPFPESARYDPAAVRAYRDKLAHVAGFGYTVDAPPPRHGAAGLLQNAIPWCMLDWQHTKAQAFTLAYGGGAIQVWGVQASSGITQRWKGQLSLQRCAYTQLTEGGPLPMPLIETHARFKDGLLTIENPTLGWAAAILGLPAGEAWERHVDGPIDIDLEEQIDNLVFVGSVADITAKFVYAFGPTAEIAAENARRLVKDAKRVVERTLAEWQTRWNVNSNDPLVRRGLSYSLAMAVPVEEGICLLTDHMLLPLSWNRDAYYAARALLAWRPRMADIVRRHLLWMFEQAERPNGVWGRCYLTNGKIKDSAFQLDQQLFPLLELAEYVLRTDDQKMLERLQPHIMPLIDRLMARRASNMALFPTDETPGDDPIALPYHLSSHILFWYVLVKLADLDVPGDWAELAEAIRHETDRAFVAEHNGRRLYAYATNGTGQYHFYHDANDLPLALAPAWGFVAADDPVWRATVDFAFSDENVGGAYGGRLGSVHTPAPWSLGDVQDLIIARAIGDPDREKRAWEHLRAAAQWDGALPEAYDLTTNKVVSRHWFAWPNAALACVVLNVFGAPLAK